MMKTNSARKKADFIVRVLLSVFLVYHLLVVLLLPSGASLEARALSRILVPYANTLAMNNSWVFFSPGPSPNIYLEYELEGADLEPLVAEAEGTDIIGDEPRIFPPPKRTRWFNDHYFRSLYVMRYFALDPLKLERYFAPWICRRHPEAASVVVRAVVEPVPGIEKAWSGESFVEMFQRVDMERHRFGCEGRDDVRSEGE